MTPKRWKPSGVVALLTDFGVQDPYVGVMKGVVLQHWPDACFVDLTHEVPAQDVRRGAWFLLHSRAFLPEGTVFLCVVDPGVGSARSLLLALDEGQAFLGPDNGLLVPALSATASFIELHLERWLRPGGSATFHGRDVLAPAAGALLAGTPPERMGRPLARDPHPLRLPRVERIGDAGLRAEVLFADRYGNLVLSAYERDLTGGCERWEVEAGGRAIPIRRAYAESAPGELLALVDSYGALEIAVRDGSAAERLGLAPGATVTMRRTP